MDYNQPSGESGPWGTRGGLVAAAAGHGGCPLELATILNDNFTITEKASTRLLGLSYGWKRPLMSNTFTFKTLLRHYAIHPTRPL